MCHICKNKIASLHNHFKNVCPLFITVTFPFPLALPSVRDTDVSTTLPLDNAIITTKLMAIKHRLRNHSEQVH